MRYLKFIQALIKYIIYGDPIDNDSYNKRLDICSLCEDKCGSKCCICGCYIKKKAKWSTEDCPKNKWD